MKVTKSDKLTLLITKQPSGTWTAISLERCIVGGGYTIEQAAEDWAKSYVAEVIVDLTVLKTKPNRVLERISEAPQIYWDIYELGAPINKTSMPIKKARQIVSFQSLKKALEQSLKEEREAPPRNLKYDPPVLAEARVG